MKSSIGIILRKQENTITALVRICLKIHGNHVKRNRTCGKRGKYLLPRRRKIGSRPISRSCLIASEEGWILHREFEICFLSNSLSVTYRSGMHVRETVGESRHVMHCCRGEYSASRSFVSKWIHGVFSNFPRIATLLPLCADTWYRIREAEALENYWISFFFKHHEVYGKLCLFYHNFQDSFLPFDPCIINLIQLKYRQFWNIYGIFNNFRKLSNNSWSLDRTSPLFKLLKHFNKIRERERIKDKDLLFAINNILCKFNFLWPIK